jgi:endoglucanase
MIAFLLSLGSSAGGWYSTKGNKIVNAAGQTVRMTGLNWFGFETNNEIIHGLWAANLESMVAECKRRGFNTWRIPISASVLQSWKAGTPKRKWDGNPSVNPDLDGLSNYDVFKKFIAAAGKNNQKVFLDVHSVIDDSYMDNLWYNAAHPAEYIISALEWFATTFKSDDTIVGIDVKNEPHGRCDKSDGTTAIWDKSTAPNNWKYFIESAAKRILAANPNLLIMVEGIECFNSPDKGAIWGWWGGNLSPVNYAGLGIDLGAYQNKLVYAPHEYGPSVSNQAWFHSGFSYDTLYSEHWSNQWMFIHEKGIAPLLFGEWGGHVDGANTVWMKAFVQLIGKYGLSQTFWCLNPNSGDTGGLIGNDWKTWDEVKYNIIKPILDL